MSDLQKAINPYLADYEQLEKAVKILEDLDTKYKTYETAGSLIGLKCGIRRAIKQEMGCLATSEAETQFEALRAKFDQKPEEITRGD